MLSSIESESDERQERALKSGRSVHMLVYLPPLGVPTSLKQAEAAFQEPSKLLLSQICLGNHSESCSFGGIYKLICSLFAGTEGRQLCDDAWVAVRSPEEASEWREKGITGRRGLVQQAGELQIPRRAEAVGALPSGKSRVGYSP